MSFLYENKTYPINGMLVNKQAATLKKSKPYTGNAQRRIKRPLHVAHHIRRQRPTIWHQ